MVWCDLNSGLVRKAESKRPNITKSIWPKITIWPNLPNISTEIAHLNADKQAIVIKPCDKGRTDHHKL